MIIKQLALFLTTAEISRRLQTALAGVSQISDTVIQLTDSQLELHGIFKAGLSIPFGTSWTVNVRPDNYVALRLVKFNAGMFGGSALGGQVLAMLADKLGENLDLTIENDCLVIALNPLLAKHGIELTGTMQRIILTPDGIEMLIS